MKLEKLGICGIISFLSYSAMVFLSPLAYPEYNWMTMAVSDLSAQGAPSLQLATQLNSLFGPCAVVCSMAVCVGVANCQSKLLKTGVYFFAGMEWVCCTGYTMFPYVLDASSTSFQNIMHLVVTVLVVIFSLLGLILIGLGAKKEGMKSLSVWAFICLFLMLMGPVGTGFLPKSVFGLFERFSTFSAVIFNMILGIYLLLGKFHYESV